MIDGRWIRDDVATLGDDGAFERAETTFRDRVGDDGSAHPAEPGRYHLYVSYACPWAHRTLVARALLGLEDAISVSVVDPHMGEGGWRFSENTGCVPDPVFSAEFLRDVYRKSDPAFTGRVTVPVLLDKQTRKIVNNESREILRMLATTFASMGTRTLELSPPSMRKAIDEMIDANYEPINNGVYKAGFARSQVAYDRAIDALFAALGRCEARLVENRYLCGDTITEADICLFTTLLRFDSVYHTHFKCNVRRVVDYPALWGFVRDVYQRPGVASTCNLDHIREHYYGSHPAVNPSGVIARGPELDFDAPHGRA